MLATLKRIGSSKITWILLLALLAASLRDTAIRDTQIDHPIRADAMDYYMSAYNLRYNGVYSRSPGNLANPPTDVTPDAYRAPGWPLTIAVFMGPWPQRDQIVQRLQRLNVMLGVATVILIFWCASLALPLPAAVVVGALSAGSPHIISLTTYILTETPAAFLATLGLALAALASCDNLKIRVASYLALGMTVGALGLFRPVFLAFPPLMALAFPSRHERRHVLILGCLGAALIVAPWLIRNAADVPAGDAPSLVATNMLEGSYRGYIFQQDPSTFPYGAHRDPTFDFTRRNLLRTLGVLTYKFSADPLGMTKWYLFEKPIYLLQWSNIEAAGDIFVYPVLATPFRDNVVFAGLHQIYYYLHPLYLFFGAIGCITPWTRGAVKAIPYKAGPMLRLASLMLTYLYLIHLPFFVTTRFVVPFLPMIFLSAVSSSVICLTWARTFIGERIAAAGR